MRTLVLKSTFQSATFFWLGEEEEEEVTHKKPASIGEVKPLALEPPPPRKGPTTLLPDPPEVPLSSVGPTLHSSERRAQRVAVQGVWGLWWRDSSLSPGETNHHWSVLRLL